MDHRVTIGRASRLRVSFVLVIAVLLQRMFSEENFTNFAVVLNSIHSVN